MWIYNLIKVYDNETKVYATNENTLIYNDNTTTTTNIHRRLWHTDKHENAGIIRYLYVHDNKKAKRDTEREREIETITITRYVVEREREHYNNRDHNKEIQW